MAFYKCFVPAGTKEEGLPYRDIYPVFKHGEKTLRLAARLTSAEASRNMQFGLRVRGRATGILMEKEQTTKPGHDVRSNSLPDCFPPVSVF